MSRALIVFGTTDGHTRTVAQALMIAFEDQGLDVDLVEAKEVAKDHRPLAYDAIVVAASVHSGGYQKNVKRWVKAHGFELSQKPTAFLLCA